MYSTPFYIGKRKFMQPEEETIPVELSRLRITGPVDDEMPLIVLLDIADAHGITLERGRETEHDYIVDSIRATPSPIGIFPFSEQDKLKIVTFVNCHVVWPEEKLLEAFAYLASFIEKETPVITEVTTEFVYGRQTPQHVYSLNPCVLYKICREHGYTVPYTISLDQLATIVYMFAEGTDKARCLLYQQTSCVNKNAIVNMYIAACDADGVDEECIIDTSTPIPDAETMRSTPISYDSIAIASDAFRNPAYLLARLQPRNSAEAIALAAMNFKIDVSRSINPLAEYEAMRKDATRYVPVDPDLCRAVQLNPYYLDLNTVFNPNLPVTLYNENELHVFAELEGFTSDQCRDESPYSLLQSAYMSDTFYHGKLPTIFNIKLCICGDNVLEESNDNVVCYGVKDVSVIAYTYADLAALFTSYCNFTNPLATSEVFSKLAINKLKNLCMLRRAGESVVALQEREKLFRAIGSVRAFELDANKKLREFHDVYKNSTPDAKKNIERTVNLLLQASMYMRGWRGNGVYPVENAEVKVEDKERVNTNSLEALHRFEQALEGLGNVGALILELPLYKYMGEFIVSTDANEGLTLGQRLAIVKQGERHENMTSCIRFTSNWVASSAYMYMLVLGLPLPFIVERLLHVN